MEPSEKEFVRRIATSGNSREVADDKSKELLMRSMRNLLVPTRREFSDYSQASWQMRCGVVISVISEIDPITGNLCYGVTFLKDSNREDTIPLELTYNIQMDDCDSVQTLDRSTVEIERIVPELDVIGTLHLTPPERQAEIASRLEVTYDSYEKMTISDAVTDLDIKMLEAIFSDPFGCEIDPVAIRDSLNDQDSGTVASEDQLLALMAKIDETARRGLTYSKRKRDIPLSLATPGCYALLSISLDTSEVSEPEFASSADETFSSIVLEFIDPNSAIVEHQLSLNISRQGKFSFSYFAKIKEDARMDHYRETGVDLLSEDTKILIAMIREKARKDGEASSEQIEFFLELIDDVLRASKG